MEGSWPGEHMSRLNEATPLTVFAMTHAYRSCRQRLRALENDQEMPHPLPSAAVNSSGASTQISQSALAFC